MDPAVIRSMCAFIYIAIFKDVLIGGYMHMLYDEDIKPSQTSQGLFKAAETVTSFLFEDCAQVGLQYFYFEKYRFRTSITIYINAGYMILRALILIVRVGRLWWSKESFHQNIDTSKHESFVNRVLKIEPCPEIGYWNYAQILIYQ